MQNKSLKLVLLGSAASGKSSWIQKLSTNNFVGDYKPTENVHVTELQLTQMLADLTEENTTVNVWDCAGQEALSGLKECYWIGADAFLVFSHPNQKGSVDQAREYIKQIRRLFDNVPIIICSSHLDEYKVRKLPFREPKCNFSSKSGEGLYQPLNLVFANLCKDYMAVKSLF